MGLDIYLVAENQKKLFPKDYEILVAERELRHKLSRDFCTLMCRRESSVGEAELNQIGRITSVDIQPIYAMETFVIDADNEAEFYFGKDATEQERKRVLDRVEQDRQKLRDNVDKVLETVNALVGKLSHIDNLYQLLNAHGDDVLGYDIYFTDFNVDKGNGYIDNNFGHDLRNFKNFLEYAKDKGATTVYFQYG